MEQYRFTNREIDRACEPVGIPMEVMGVAVAINALIDFPATGINTSGWQLTLIDVADSLDILDADTLRN